ncbi:isochorismate synthase MenF [Melioribacteraceae bacterium 4301-Me]|uniref:isochorismate synthase n=1 Tax=Pyranulibacter aquaticus TaxID=3163344 RepID=UPI003596F1E4
MEILKNFKSFFDSSSEFDNTIKINPNEKLLVSYLFSSAQTNFKKLINKLTKTNVKYFYWSEVERNVRFLAIDSLFTIKTNGQERINDAENLINYWQKKFINNWQDYNLNCVPLFVGGIKFSPDQQDSIWNDFADSEWFVPKYLFLEYKNNFYTVINILTYKRDTKEFEKHLNIISHFFEEDDYSVEAPVKFITNLPDDKNEWESKVKQTLQRIHQHEFKKIVISRRVEMTLSGNPDVYKLLNELETKYPTCHVFAFRASHSTFFGATPEVLARIYDGYIEADALAGSFPRGKDEIEDKKFENELLHSKKNLAEQSAVVEFITDSFSEFSEGIIFDAEPKVKKLPNIQHLWTPIKAKIKQDQSIFSIIKSIFPTPAICGIPWSESMDFIREVEGYSRGLYAGVIGWFNFNKESKLVVAIRSALLKDRKLYAFAGCGIVDGSDPQSEYFETELKLKPILSLFDIDKNFVN